MANIFPTGIDPSAARVFIPELWALDYMDAAQFERNIVNRCYTPKAESFKYGDIVHIPNVSNMTATDKTEDVDIVFESITERDTDVLINKHKYVAFVVEDIVVAQSHLDVVKTYRSKIAYPLERAKEITVSDLFDNFSTSVGILGQPPTWSTFTTVWQNLQEAGVGAGNISDDVSMFLSPAMVAACAQMDIFTNKDYGAGNVAVDGKFQGKVLGMPVFTTNLLYSPVAGQHANAAFHRTALCFIDQVGIKIESDYIIAKSGDAVLAQTIYGAIEMALAPETAGGGVASDLRGVYIPGL